MRYLSFDVGGTNTKYSLITGEGEMLDSNTIKTIDNKKELFKLIKEIVERYKNKGEKISGLAFSMPGVIDVERGYMITGGALFDFYEFDFKDELEKYIGIPVELENDVNCVALAEKWLGNAKKNENFLCVTVGTGIGGAIYMNNSLVRGAKYSAGEFGFMFVEKKKNNNSLSMTGSVRGGLIQKYAELKGRNWEELNGKEIFDLAKNNDEIAKKIIDDFYNSLAYMIYNLSVCFNPEKILIGGEITRREEFIECISEKIKKIKEGVCSLEFPKLERCKFLNESGKVGAVYHFLEMEQKR